MKILITGAAGFIGANFAHIWVKRHPKDKVKIVDSLTFAGNIHNLDPIRKKIQFIEADINDRTKVKEAVKGVDAIVHFAAESHVDRSVFEPEKFWKTNVEGTLTLLEEAHRAGVPRFHHISTDEVYGELPLDSDEKFTEDTPYAPRPDNLYAVSKAEADRVVMDFYKKTGMFITISNCSNNYGPYQFPEKFVPIVITNLIDGLKAPIHGDGLNVRDWIHTEDHCKAIELILEKGKPGETYLVGSNNDRPNKYIAQRIVELYGKDESWIKYVPDRHSNDRRYAIDSTKISKELGWKPEIGRENFDQGLRETIEWYKKNKDWWKPLLKRKAVITDDGKKIAAHITLDREVGKVRFVLEEAESLDEEKDVVLKEKLLKEDPRRVRLIKGKLKSRRWFSATDKKIKEELLALAKNARASGFVEDLANRPDIVGSVKQLRLLKLEYSPKEYPIYGIVAWFEVENGKKEKRAEAYYSWGMGPKSGAKLLVLLKIKGVVSHVALIKEEKFPVGSVVYGLAGGFPSLNESVFQLILRKLKEDLRIDARGGFMKISEIISLGRVMPDAGMTNNHPLLYAITIDVSEKTFPPLKTGEMYDGADGVVLWPISRLTELINRVDDSYLLAALSRLTLGGISNIKLG